MERDEGQAPATPALPVVLGLRWQRRLILVLVGALPLAGGILLLAALPTLPLSWGVVWLALVAATWLCLGLYFSSACIPGAWCLRLDAQVLTIRSAWRERHIPWAAIAQIKEFSRPKAHILLALRNDRGLRVSIQVVVNDLYALRRRELTALLRKLHALAPGHEGSSSGMRAAAPFP